ncbi:hypothetical protein APS56_00855 [Pseudalgibacter alginicilyticus]|uniref:Uncharacterized protein n=1 Tax=Pseudalgibacter alginicilyticus TaxID=1736674 RepID=A0A0P0D7N6_9FLAO|nr:hypothetical protein [Pseudalgibacter alginicilyticus]ALJ03786.1 hypothetical protein APS56_00855 [Pseudalgibacter alginicilyticus]
MNSLEKLNDKATQTAFNKKVISATHHLHPYVKHRIYIGESMKILPKNMYTSNGIIDESIIKLFENGYNIDNDTSDIKLKLFKIVDADLYTLFKKEAFHNKTMSTTSILQEELDDLEENYTIDDDLDYIMTEELNDISYKQHNKHQHLFLYDDNNSSILNAFNKQDLTLDNSKKALGNLYSWLPLNVSNIVDLYVFGKLSFEEISQIKTIEIKRIELIFDEIKKNFNDHVN